MKFLVSPPTSITMPREEWKCKRQKQPIQVARHNCEHLPGPSTDTLKTSTQLIKKVKQENLTLWDWLTVYTYVDTLPQPVNQGEVVKYFATRPQGALLFSQPTLSCKTAAAPRDGGPCGFNSECIVMQTTTCCHKTRYRSCIVAVGPQMDRKGEPVNSSMLMAKWEAFEKDLEVPEDERLPGPGWIQPFCTV